ncbi:hypothetical protein TVAG_227660 [Trichomonas vaginalis G3]|uniref:Uncharacterized protein n=1 Tax=Trichomonas vaginalis (strain ATCC PRA-98 / G3) TaxID=412133 RepID=A2ERR8_TRIV3|nr:positive regulation of myosin-light-chain-phosphatase protein [Trichomonas vaginalis G3]EAY04649.1 hypothetical protein TVAG_227660 [Trichomonas vaginalis G3]KAI5549424.1 positive regulation of myosin-light-chain-phosphatase protein [Trichomonas vaginalis G3]|eukprot:XP_001316872.1 hypothetical protein [Trichomonas vaginalis G3]
MCAIIYKYKEIAELLILHGANVNMQDFTGMAALHYTVLHISYELKNNAKDLIELLLSNGADVNAKTHTGMTPLHYAAQGGKNELFEILISNGADIHALNKDKKTPVDLAVESEKTKNDYDEETYKLASHVLDLFRSMNEL